MNIDDEHSKRLIELASFTVENALASIFWMDESGKLHFANHTAQRQYGYSEEEFMNMNVLELNPNFSKEAYSDLWKQVRQEKRVRVESTHVDKDGKEFPVEVFVNNTNFQGKSYNVSFVLDITERKRKEKLLNSLSAETATTLGTGFFETLVKHISESLGVKMVLATIVANKEKTRLRTLAYYSEGQLKENIEFSTEGTPCKNVFESNEPYYLATGVKDHFPKESSVEGYFGVPIFVEGGDCLGHIGLFHDKALILNSDEKEILKIFSDRAGVELERNLANERLMEALNEVELLKNRLEAENSYLQEEINLEHNFQEIITRSERFKAILSNIEQVAVTDATVLISGESGTGKELLARAIHNISKRVDRPLVKVNCAALPANLIESELFGHEKGAFTGAIAKKIGRFELADGGTLFLDEMGELPLELQSKLLRALQEGEFEKVGSTKTQKVDVRVIAATNRDLESEVSHGKFRADLYYRLNVFPVESIALRERKEDISLLVKHFVAKFSAKVGKQISNIPKRVITSLQSYDWPGNIRELENVIERAVILSATNTLELGDWIPKKVEVSTNSEFDTLAEFERKYILSVLQKTSWRVSGERGAAKILDMRPTTLESRMKKLGIKRGF